METCNWCGKEIEDGYLADDYYVMCEECRHNIYSNDEFSKNIMTAKYFGLLFMIMI